MLAGLSKSRYGLHLREKVDAIFVMRNLNETTTTAKEHEAPFARCAEYFYPAERDAGGSGCHNVGKLCGGDLGEDA